MARPRFSALIVVNLSLLILFPAAWVSPLARAGWLPFFSGDAITVLGGIRDLWESDAALAVLVALFAIVIPYTKTIVLALVHFRRLGRRALTVVEAIGKLSMADVFLIALYIVLVKGVGIGHVVSAWGLWLFTACVLASLWVGFETRRRIESCY